MEVQFFGNVGKDAEVKTTQDNREQVSFVVAENVKRNGQESTNWVNCWYGVAKLAPYLKKGQRVYIRGELVTSIYTTKDGKQQVGYSVYVNKVELLGGQPTAQSEGNGNQAYVSKMQGAAPEPPVGDLPF